MFRNPYQTKYMKKFLLIFFLFIGFQSHSQEEKKTKNYFSDALFMHLPKYSQKAEKAYRLKQYDKAEELFDSLVTHNLAGFYMNNFKFKNLKKKQVALYDFKKPVYLLTYASWCIPGKGEMPALNEIARKYKDRIDVVILFWDKRKTVKKLTKDLDKNIEVLYVDETQNNDAFVVKQLKHSLGLPTCFLINENKIILDIQRSVFHPYDTSEKESFDLYFEAIESGIAEHLVNYEEKEEVANLVMSPN